MEPAASAGRNPQDAERLRKKWKRLLIVGIALSLGPIAGVLGMALGMGLSYHRIETMAAPTPRDLSQGVWIGTASAGLGMIAGIAGALLVLQSFRKLSALRPKSDSLESDSGPWT